MRGKLGIVRYHDDEPVGRDLTEQIHYLNARFGIERAGRLVGKKYFRIVHKCARYRHTLHLPAGELIRFFLHLLRKSDLFESMSRAFTPFGFGYSGEGQRKLDI